MLADAPAPQTALTPLQAPSFHGSLLGGSLPWCPTLSSSQSSGDGPLSVVNLSMKVPDGEGGEVPAHTEARVELSPDYSIIVRSLRVGREPRDQLLPPCHFTDGKTKTQRG